MANYSTPGKVMEAIRSSDQVEFVRSTNRSKILLAANNAPPLGKEEADALGVKIDVNWGEMLVLITHAAGQLLSAFRGNQNFFTVKIPLAPAEHKADWEATITKEINRPIMESSEKFVLDSDRWKCLSLNGVAVMRWPQKDHWLPRFVALSDTRIPTDTEISFRNLKSFAIRVHYTVFELVEAALNDKPNNCWDKPSVLHIIQAYKQANMTQPSNNYVVNTDVEKFVELMKQDGGYFSSSALPTIPLYHFYFEDLDADGVKGWYMRIVPETGYVRGAEDAYDNFLWQHDKPVAKSWKEIIHSQFGDLSADTPAKFHSVRGLGFMLMEPCFYTNLALNGLLQHTFENFQIWLRLADPGEKARASVQEFANLRVLKTGVSIVPQQERHQIDANLVESVLAKLKQLQGESSASYTQSNDNGTAKEQTAFETRVKLEQVNALMTAILTMAFTFEVGSYREICRRFCLRDSTDPDIVKFQMRCRGAGIPPEFLNVEHWEVDAVTPLGMGNPTIAQAAADQLMQVRPMCAPQAQQEILHEKILAVTKDPRKAERWAPIAGNTTQSDAYREAQGAFGALMQGVPMPLASTNLVDQIEAIMPLLAGKIQLFTKRNNMATADEAAALMNVLQYLEQAIQQLSQDKTMADKTTQYGNSIGQLNNEIKGLAQRGAQAAQAQAEAAQKAQDGESQAALQMEAMKAKQESEIAQARAQQEMKLKDQAFSAEQRRLDEKHTAEIRRAHVKTASELTQGHVKTDAEMKLAAVKTAAELSNSAAKTDADIANAKKKADAAPEPTKPSE